MKRKELLKLLVPPLNTQLAVSDKSQEKRFRYWNNNEVYYETVYNFIYIATVDSSTGEDILIVDFYKPSGQHIKRHFQDKKNGYFSYLTQEGKLSSAGIDYMLEYSYRKSYHCDKETKNIICSFLNKKVSGEKDAIRLLGDSAKQIKANKLKVRYDKIRKSVSDAMLEIREVPKPVLEWVEKTLMIDSRYIFYEYAKRKQIKGHCTYCHNDVLIKEPKDNQSGICPHCHSKIVFKSLGRFNNSCGFTDKGGFYYFQKTSKGFCVRRYEVIRNISPACYKHPIENKLYETQRAFYVFDSDKKCFEINSYYEWGEFRNTGTCAWNNNGAYCWNSRCLKIYPSNLNQLLKHESFTAYHTDFNLIARKCGEISPNGLIKNPQEQVVIGHLANAKLYNLASDLINNNMNDAELRKGSIKLAFGISKDDLPDMQELDPSYQDIKFYRELRKKEGFVDLEEFNFIRDNTSSYRVVSEALRHTTLHNIVRYSKEQISDFTKKSWSYPLEELLRDWIDYIGNAILLGMNIKKSNVKFPRDFHAAHDAAYEAVNAAEECEGGLQIVAIAKMEKELNKKYYFEDKSFLIRAPHDHRDIIHEGEKLDHCVARYAKGVAKGETIILFIRKIEEPEEPYYTLELNPEYLEVEQCRGYKNNRHTPVDENVMAFVEKWKAARLVEKSVAVSA